MCPRSHSENTYYSVLATRRLGEMEFADRLVTGLAAHTELLARTPAKIDYFATSLPALLLFGRGGGSEGDGGCSTTCSGRCRFRHGLLHICALRVHALAAVLARHPVIKIMVGQEVDAGTTFPLAFGKPPR